MEVNDDDKFITSTWLEEQMLHIREANVNFVSLRRDESNSILMDLETTRSFTSDKVWSDDQIV